MGNFVWSGRAVKENSDDTAGLLPDHWLISLASCLPRTTAAPKQSGHPLPHPAQAPHTPFTPSLTRYMFLSECQSQGADVFQDLNCRAKEEQQTENHVHTRFIQ